MPWYVYSKEQNGYVPYEKPLKPIIMVNTRTKETTRILGIKTLMEMSGKSRDIVTHRIDHRKLTLKIGDDEFILKNPLELKIVVIKEETSYCLYGGEKYVGVSNIEKLRSRENFHPKF